MQMNDFEVPWFLYMNYGYLKNDMVYESISYECFDSMSYWYWKVYDDACETLDF